MSIENPLAEIPKIHIRFVAVLQYIGGRRTLLHHNSSLRNTHPQKPVWQSETSSTIYSNRTRSMPARGLHSWTPAASSSADTRCDAARCCRSRDTRRQRCSCPYHCCRRCRCRRSLENSTVRQSLRSAWNDDRPSIARRHCCRRCDPPPMTMSWASR